jgi:predicted acylesterase/phospholipase RssA
MSSSSRTRAHLVLGSGGVKTLTYVGALEVIQDAGIEIASVSACSAGSLVGALIATGQSANAIRASLEAIDLRQFVAAPTRPGPLRWISRLRWPFAPYSSEPVVRLMQDLLGEHRTFGDLPIPFATAAVDLLTQQLLVYASETHGSMNVADAVRIAVGIPWLFPPHDVGGRVVIDAAIATQCPVWMVGRFDDEYPIIALKPLESTATTPPQWIPRFVVTLLGAGVACRDQYLVDEIPRAHVMEMPVLDLDMQDFAGAERRKRYLFELGRRVAAQCLQRWGTDLAGDHAQPVPMSRTVDHTHDERAIATASALMQGFANRLSHLARKQVFISYSHLDHAWLDVIKAPLEPYVTSHGLQVWDDTRIPPGELWRDAINKALASTRVALLLVSPRFLNSEFIRTEELGYFLEAAGRYAVKVHWVLLSDLNGLANPLADRQAVIDLASPLDQLSPADLVRALARLARVIAREVDA